MPRKPQITGEEIQDAADRMVGKEPRHLGGRPTDFTPELGEQILERMEAGLSLAAAAADLNIHRQRVYEWVERHPEFADTIRLAQVKRQLFLERRLLSADQGPVVTSTIFALKNAGPEDWREKREVELSGTVKSSFDADALRSLTEEQLEQLRSIAGAISPEPSGDDPGD